jgi:hypothetical protein
VSGLNIAAILKQAEIKAAPKDEDKAKDKEKLEVVPPSESHDLLLL